MRIFVIWDVVAPAVRTLVEALPELLPHRPKSATPAPDVEAESISWGIPGVTLTGKETARDVIAAGVRGADHVIALLDRPSASVGWQIGLALGWGKSLQLASIGAALPSWTQVGALKGLFTHHLNDVTGMAALLEPLVWQLPEVPAEVPASQTAQTLLLCPSGPIGSTLREVALRDGDRRGLPEEGWGLYELPPLLSGLVRVVWVLASDGRGQTLELADNASNGVVAGFAEARGLRVAVLRADDIPAVIDVQPREHRFRNLPEFKQKLQTVSTNTKLAPPTSAPQQVVTAPFVEKKARRWALLALLLLVAFGGLGLALHGRSQKTVAKPLPVSAPVVVVVPSPPDLGAPPAKSAPPHGKPDKHAANRSRRSGSPAEMMDLMNGMVSGFVPQGMMPDPGLASADAPPPPRHRSQGCAFDDEEWKSVIAAVQREVFQGRWTTFADSTKTRCLTINQLLRSIDMFPLTSDRARLLRWVGPRVRDPENAYLLEDRLKFTEERQACAQQFSCCQSSCAVVRAP